MESIGLTSAIRLSAALIVKDEEGRLPRSLSALKGFDEVVILDTGSTDKTVEVAKGLGARVRAADPLIVPFHFAEARNRVLDLCENDWIVSVDADEELAFGSADKIKEAILGDRGKYSGYRLHFVFAPESEYERFVIFDRRHWRWINRVHNALDLIGPNQNVRDLKDVTLSHFVPAADRRPWRVEQTFELLQAEVRENPHHHRAWRHLGLEYMLRKKYEDALACFRKYVSTTREGDADRFHGMLYVASAHEKLNRVEDALNWYRKAAELCPRRREARWRAALLLLRYRRMEEGLLEVERTVAVKASERPQDWLAHADAWGDLPERTLAWYLDRGYVLKLK